MDFEVHEFERMCLEGMSMIITRAREVLSRFDPEAITTRATEDLSGLMDGFSARWGITYVYHKELLIGTIRHSPQLMEVNSWSLLPRGHKLVRSL